MQKLLILLTILLPVGALSLGDPAPTNQDPGRIERERGLKLFVEILRELSATGQTNLAEKVSNMVEAEQLQDLTFQLRTQVGILRQLREGNTNLIESLETSIDTSIVTLARFGKWGVEQQKAFQFAKQYRTKYPRKTHSPELDAKVAGVLSTVKGK